METINMNEKFDQIGRRKVGKIKLAVNKEIQTSDTSWPLVPSLLVHLEIEGLRTEQMDGWVQARVMWIRKFTM